MLVPRAWEKCHQQSKLRHNVENVPWPILKLRFRPVGVRLYIQSITISYIHNNLFYAGNVLRRSTFSRSSWNSTTSWRLNGFIRKPTPSLLNLWENWIRLTWHNNNLWHPYGMILPRLILGLYSSMCKIQNPHTTRNYPSCSEISVKLGKCIISECWIRCLIQFKGSIAGF